MSARLSTGLPRACSGLMYAAVPRIAPACVAAIESVGDMDTFGSFGSFGPFNFGRPKSRISPIRPPSRSRCPASGRDGRSPLVVRSFEGVGNLARDTERLVERDRSIGNTRSQRRPLDEFHDEVVGPTSNSVEMLG